MQFGSTLLVYDSAMSGIAMAGGYCNGAYYCDYTVKTINLQQSFIHESIQNCQSIKEAHPRCDVSILHSSSLSETSVSLRDIRLGAEIRLSLRQTFILLMLKIWTYTIL